MGKHGSLSRRLGAFALIMVVMVLGLGIRLLDYQVVRAEQIREESFKSRSITQTLPALRGQIRDS
ncbi:MAG: hypothetical protein RL402_543, partial [Actinomycetota bacterium]